MTVSNKQSGQLQSEVARWEIKGSIANAYNVFRFVFRAEIMQKQMRVNMWVITVWRINHEHTLPVDTVASSSPLFLKLATDIFLEQYIKQFNRSYD